MHSQLNILPPNTMQPNITEAIDLTFSEHTGSVDAVVKSVTKGLVEAISNGDAVTKQITDKGLTDTVRLNDWFTIKHNPQSDPWS